MIYVASYYRFLVEVIEFEYCLQVMTCRPRTDLYINLPALRKLDHMLIVRLDLFLLLIFYRFYP